ncbi:unnamed protein product [Anisakis simplex]|uniref:7TM_GPCR_Srx domain-containing protein n=1 Tax=Anisakis simplex TaxID=6269 RepID=A0A0M3K668_ANISI|nr:unnamed protein product [Anisakis simplex]
MNDTSTELTATDIAVGVSYIIYAGIGIVAHLFEIIACVRLTKDYITFSFFAQQSFAEVLLLFQYGIWEGAVILANSEITTPHERIYVYVLTNWTWWASSYLSVAVPTTRLLCVVAPVTFRRLTAQLCHLICLAVWLIALLQSYAATLFPWFSGMYFDPRSYGMVADRVKYAYSGTETYYLTFNILVIFSNLTIYTIIFISLTKMARARKTAVQIKPSTTRLVADRKTTIDGAALPAQVKHERVKSSVEFDLLISCFVNWIVTVIGR